MLWAAKPQFDLLRKLRINSLAVPNLYEVETELDSE